MPRYWPIRSYPSIDRAWIIDRLLDLRGDLDAAIPAKTPTSLLLATWNIRDFDSNKFRHGPRLPESFHYLAEIIDRFHLVAVQEINRDMRPLERLMGLLGPHWDYLVTGVTEDSLSGGNQERMAFLFDTNHVRFTNLAGQVVLARNQLIAPTPAQAAANPAGFQIARTPFMASFQAGWFKFVLCTVHIYFGSESGAQLERRITEIRKLARYFKNLQAKEPTDYILLGDFNIVSPQHRTMEALKSAGFTIPEELRGLRTNLGGNRYYDQIAFKRHDQRLEKGAAGVFDFRSSLFRPEHFDHYYHRMPANFRDFHTRGRRRGERRNREEQMQYYLNEWLSWQMSDHLLLWTELKVDFTNAYLGSLRPGEIPLADPPPEEDGDDA